MSAPATYCNWGAMHQARDAAAYVVSRGGCAYEILVLIVIASHASQQDRTCWLGIDTIAAEAGCSRKTVQRSLAALTTYGLLESAARTGQTHLYRLTISDAHTQVPQTPHPGLLDTCVPQSHVSHSPGGQVPQTWGSGLIDTPPRSVGPGGQVYWTPEVQKEVQKRSRKTEVDNLTRQQDGGTEQVTSPVVSPQSQGEARTGAQGQSPASRLQPLAVQRRQAALAQQASAPNGQPSPARLLSDLYFEHLGQPARLTTQLAAAWPTTFHTLLATHSYDTLRGAIDYAWADKFWADKLPRRSGDPVEYFADKAPTIIDQYLRNQEDAARAAKPATEARNQHDLPGIRINHV